MCGSRRLWQWRLQASTARQILAFFMPRYPAIAMSWAGLSMILWHLWGNSNCLQLQTCPWLVPSGLCSWCSNSSLYTKRTWSSGSPGPLVSGELLHLVQAKFVQFPIPQFGRISFKDVLLIHNHTSPPRCWAFSSREDQSAVGFSLPSGSLTSRLSMLSSPPTPNSTEGDTSCGEFLLPFSSPQLCNTEANWCVWGGGLHHVLKMVRWPLSYWLKLLLYLLPLSSSPDSNDLPGFHLILNGVDILSQQFVNWEVGSHNYPAPLSP